MQGILSVQGIVGYKWVPVRLLACFFQNKIFFYWTKGGLKTRKLGTQSYAKPSVQYSLADVTHDMNINNNKKKNFYLYIHQIQIMTLKQIEIYVEHN